MTATLLDPAAVCAAFWGVALEDAQLSENNSACMDDREPEQFYGEPAAEYCPKYRAAIDSICAQAEPVLRELDLNRFPRDKGESNLSHTFGSDLYMTSHGHGVGFWDGDWGPAGDALDELAKQAPSGDLAHHKDGGLFFL